MQRSLMLGKRTDNEIAVIKEGLRLGNGPGAFFLRPVLKTVFGCVWSRDWQSWFAPNQDAKAKASKLCESLEAAFTQVLNQSELDLVLSLLPQRDKD